MWFQTLISLGEKKTLAWFTLLYLNQNSDLKKNIYWTRIFTEQQEFCFKGNVIIMSLDIKLK